MVEKTQNLSVTLGGNQIESKIPDQPRILEILNPEIKEDLDKTDYVVLGEKEKSFIALPKEITNIKNEPVEHASTTVYYDQHLFLLVVNEKGTPQYKTLVLNTYKPEPNDNVTFGEVPALKEFKELITQGHCPDVKSCLYDYNSGILTYGPHIIHSDKAIKQGGISFKERDLEHHLQDSTPDEINRLIALNKKTLEPIPSAA